MGYSSGRKSSSLKMPPGVFVSQESRRHWATQVLGGACSAYLPHFHQQF